MSFSKPSLERSILTARVPPPNALKESVAKDAGILLKRFGEKGYAGYSVSIEDDYVIRVSVPTNFTYAAYKFKLYLFTPFEPGTSHEITAKSDKTTIAATSSAVIIADFTLPISTPVFFLFLFTQRKFIDGGKFFYYNIISYF